MRIASPKFDRHHPAPKPAFCALAAIALHLVAILPIVLMTWRTLDDFREACSDASVPVIAWTILEFGLAYLFWRIAWRRDLPAAGWFRFFWLWSSASGLVVFPFAYLAFWLLLDHPALSMALWPAYLVIAPTLFASSRLRLPSRWRPVCPECGHSVVFAQLPRCAECGENYPAPRPFFRRWAVRRIPWERRQRTIPIAYVQSALMVLLTPWRAAWRLGTPDQVGRAVRWWLGNFILFFALLSMLVVWLPRSFPLDWRQTTTIERETGLSLGELPVLSPLPACSWMSAWALGLAAPVLFGIFLSMVWPQTRPAARIGMVKWSLYCGIVPLGLALIVFGNLLSDLNYVFTNEDVVARVYQRLIGFRISDDLPVVRLIAAGYGFIWAFGSAAQPYGFRRGLVMFVVSFIAFCGAWGVLLRLFDFHDFEVLI